MERVHPQMGATAEEFGLAPAQALALNELETDHPLSMRELAARLKCDPSNITGLIDRLEARGLVRRETHPGDRRIKYLVLTEAGQQIRARLQARLYSAPPCMSCMDEADQRTLYELLSRMLGT
jgi:DNA-binding MarR family transcriptional regulator